MIEEITYQNDLAFARSMDKQDELNAFRDHFYLPKMADGQEHVYLCGN